MDSLMASALNHVAFGLLNVALAAVGVIATLGAAAAFRRVRRKAAALTAVNGGRTPSTSCAA